MDPDPMQYVEGQDDDEKVKEKAEAKNARKLNTLVAISVALLATFMGIFKTKDDNIVQAMQQAQADKIDNYSWYQARNIREEIAKATIAELTAQSAGRHHRHSNHIRTRSRSIRRSCRTKCRRSQSSKPTPKRQTRPTTTSIITTTSLIYPMRCWRSRSRF